MEKISDKRLGELIIDVTGNLQRYDEVTLKHQFTSSMFAEVKQRFTDVLSALNELQHLRQQADIKWPDASITNIHEVFVYPDTPSVPTIRNTLRAASAMLRRWADKYGKNDPDWLAPSGHVSTLELIDETLGIIAAPRSYRNGLSDANGMTDD